MRKKTISRKTKPELCPLLKEECKNFECMWYHQQFEKCNIEIVGYNLFKLSKTIENLLSETVE